MYEDEESVESKPTYLTQLAGKDIIQLKSNSFPRGLVPLEDIFDNNDVAKIPKVAPRDDEVEECNIGTEKDPKVIKISKNLLHLVLESLGFIYNLIPDLLHFHKLVNPTLEWI
jgi:hypothetical protein